MQVLVALSRSGGEPVSRETLIDCCWGGRVVTDGALNRSVAQLRKALRDPGFRSIRLRRWGIGYRQWLRLMRAQRQERSFRGRRGVDAGADRRRGRISAGAAGGTEGGLEGAVRAR